MTRDFLHLSALQQHTVLSKAAEKLTFNEASLEKDIWLCWILEKLFQLPIFMVFKGGTSLSKAFNLIDRFSEDIDITIDSKAFIPNFKIKDTSASQLKKVSKHLQSQLGTYLQETVFHHLKKCLETEFPAQESKLILDEPNAKILIEYPSIVNHTTHYLRDHILLEFGARNSIMPAAQKVITPYVRSVLTEDVTLPVATVPVLSPIRTFWEKATLMHVEARRARQIPSRLSRHWYDLYQLALSWVGERALADLSILKSVLEYKTAFFNASYAHYGDCAQGHFKLIPDDSNLTYLKEDFETMREAGMFIRKPPAFDVIISSLRKLEVAINTRVLGNLNQ